MDSVSTVGPGPSSGGALPAQNGVSSVLVALPAHISRASQEASPSSAFVGEISLTHAGQGQFTNSNLGNAGRRDTVDSLGSGLLSAYAGSKVSNNRTMDTLKWFSLPPGETLHDEFHCALRKRVLLQGRMYVFDHYVCFSSSVFGYVKKKVIPFTELSAVRKKTHFRFPNSIELEYSEGRREFFTSFLSRDEAYKVIMNNWSQVMANPGKFIDPELNRRARNSDAFDTQDGSHVGPLKGVSFEVNSSSGNILQRRSGSLIENEDEDEGEDEDDTGVWAVENHSAPPPLVGFKPVVHAVLPGTPKDFFDVVLADDAPFLEDFLNSQGNRRINISTWKRHEQLGHVRDLQFTAPIKGAFGNWGVSHAACYQSHRFCLYQDNHVVFESSQTMADIPYGDCFTVDLRWDVREELTLDDIPAVAFDVLIRVPFTRKCLFKSVIESGSFKQVQETYTALVEQLRPILRDKYTSRVAVNLRTPRSMGDLGQLTPRASGSRSTRLTGAASVLRASASMHRSTSQGGLMGQSIDGDGVAYAGGQGDGSPSRSALLGRVVDALTDRMNGLVEVVLDNVMSVVSCGISREMRMLFTVLLFMLFINICMFVMLMLKRMPAGGLAAQQSAATAAGMTAGGALPQVDALYWQTRLGMLQQELGLLQGRMEYVSKEMAAVASHLTSMATTAAASAEAAAAAAAAATPLVTGEL